MKTEDCDNKRLVLELQQQTMWQIAGNLTKGFAFYLAILAALLGYVMSLKLAPGLQSSILCASIAITVLFGVAAGAIARCLDRHLTSVEKSLKEVASTAYDELNAAKFFTDIRTAAKVTGVCSFLVLLILLSGAVLLLMRL